MREAATFDDGWLHPGSYSYTYWDADKLAGCFCDDGWTGIDCSTRFVAASRSGRKAPSLTRLTCSRSSQPLPAWGRPTDDGHASCAASGYHCG